MDKALLDVIHGKKANRVPIWLMRQAGRYLPEYRELRSKAGNFLDLCLTPKLASEITIQPIKRFDFDAAILFADILLIPNALGQKLEFIEGKGPVLDPLENEKSLTTLKFNPTKLSPVLETIDLVKNRLPQKTALIGFCGGLWTVAAYMIDGTSKDGFSKAKMWAKNEPELLNRLIAILLDASEKYLCRQIEAGAEALQIFESWAGLLSGEMFEHWVIAPSKELIRRVKQEHPNIPIIGFPREAGAHYKDYAMQTGIDALSLDQNISLDDAVKLKSLTVLQGNLDPLLLIKGGDDMKRAAENILVKLGPRHIFNLGHGVLPETPVEHVATLVEIVRNYKAA